MNEKEELQGNGIAIMQSGDIFESQFYSSAPNGICRWTTSRFSITGEFRCSQPFKLCKDNKTVEIYEARFP